MDVSDTTVVKLSARDRELIAQLREPAPVGGRFGVNRYLYALYERDPNLRSAFPDLDRDGAPFVEWLHAYGQEQYSIIDELMPPAPKAFEHFDPRIPVLGKALPPDVGVNVMSFLRAELGTGEAGRLLVAALDERRIPVLPLESTVRPDCRHAHAFETAAAGGVAFPITITCANPDWMGHWAHSLGKRFFLDRYSIGYWWWEVEGPTPFDWRPNFRLVDEVWTASEHIAATLRPALDVPIRTMTFPVAVTPPPPASRAALGLPDGFVFLTMFDYASALRRKNPLAVIDAFRRSFAPGDGPSLVVKCINHTQHREAHRALMAAVADHPDICVIDRYVSPEVKDAMVASCDCYVSLHRAEGFGLPLAEAMFLGKPTIATAYSGNLEFQNQENSYLVGFQLVPIGGDGTQYPANGVWAEPDVEQAAALMRRVFHDQAAGRAVGARAAADIRRTHSLQAAGVSMERRLERIARELELWPSDEPTGRSAAAPLIERGPAPPTRSTFGFAGRPARRLLLRALKPLTSHQRAVDSRMVSELEQARDDLAKLRALELRVAAARAAELARSRRAADPDDRSLTVRVSALERKLTPPHALVPLERFDSPVGRVEGFRQSMNGRRPADPYLEFENVFRGPERVVRDRQQRYLQLIGHRQPVLDLGCGRGEFLEVLRQDGLSAHGVDLDRAMVEHCRGKGLDVSEADVVDHLETLSDASVGVVFASQVIEHLPYPRLLRFLGAARAKLRPAGLLIVETPNPHHPLALRNFWIDPTHQHPLFPEVVLALCRLSGFTGGYIWHPGGIGDPDQDRTAQPDYAIVAEVTAAAAASPVPGAVSVVTDVGELWYPEHCEVLTPAVQQSGTWDAPDGAAIRAALAPGMTVVDVGAHVGYFALLAAHCVGPSGKVVAVEPAPENYAMLAANVARAGATQVEPVHAAAWREAGELELRLSPTNTGDHRVYDVGANRTATRVPAVLLDDVLADCDRLDFVIVDTQGAEQPVLEGMSAALARWRPRLQVEFWPDAIREFGDDPEATLAFYRGLAYDIHVLDDPDATDGGDDLTRLVGLAESRPGGFCTLLLSPRSD